METAVYAIAAVVSLVGGVIVFCAFIWAARKDGEEDRAVQKKLGTRRKSWFGL